MLDCLNPDLKISDKRHYELDKLKSPHLWVYIKQAIFFLG